MDWKEVGTHFEWKVWARQTEGRWIYVVKKEQPTPEQGGYFNLDSALRQKGFSDWDINWPNGRPDKI